MPGLGASPGQEVRHIHLVRATVMMLLSCIKMCQNSRFKVRIKYTRPEHATLGSSLVRFLCIVRKRAVLLLNTPNHASKYADYTHLAFTLWLGYADHRHQVSVPFPTHWHPLKQHLLVAAWFSNDLL